MPRSGQRRTRSAARRADVTVTDKEAGETPLPDNSPTIVMASAAPPESPPVADPSDAGQPVCSPEDVVGFPPLSANSGKASRGTRSGSPNKSRAAAALGVRVDPGVPARAGDRVEQATTMRAVQLSLEESDSPPRKRSDLRSDDRTRAPLGHNSARASVAAAHRRVVETVSQLRGEDNVHCPAEAFNNVLSDEPAGSGPVLEGLQNRRPRVPAYKDSDEPVEV